MFKEFVLPMAACGLCLCIVFGSAIGVIEMYKNYTEKTACEEFSKANKDEKVFYSRGTDCIILHNGYWSRLR